MRRQHSHILGHFGWIWYIEMFEQVIECWPFRNGAAHEEMCQVWLCRTGHDLVQPMQKLVLRSIIKPEMVLDGLPFAALRQVPLTSSIGPLPRRSKQQEQCRGEHL